MPDISTLSDGTPTWPNAMGVLGIEFVEFAAEHPQALGRLFERFGFKRIAQHRHKAVTLYRQGDISFLINSEPDSFAQRCAALEGVSACAVAFRVDDAAKAMAVAEAGGAWTFELGASGPMELNIPAVSGIGSSPIYFVDRWRGKDGRRGGIGDISIYDVDFLPLDPETAEEDMHPAGVGLMTVDHITQRVPAGQLQEWMDFYGDVFGFREIHGVDSQWHVARTSRVMVSPGGGVRLPLYEEGTEQTVRMTHFLGPRHGDGIQHIALSTKDILSTVSQLRAQGVRFVRPPPTYYDELDARLPGHGQDTAALRAHDVLLDGDVCDGAVSSLFFQAFAQYVEGELMFEIVQRDRNHGFGEGNLEVLSRCTAGPA